MVLLWIGLGIVALLTIATLIVSFICYRMAFYVKEKECWGPDEYPIPQGLVYEPFREPMEEWIRQTRAMPHEKVSITSFDGLTLRGKFFEFAPGAPIEIMFPGYRGNAERDMCGGAQRCFALGHSALIVNQRSCVDSDGNVITFGIRESRDCLDWVDFTIRKFGPEVKIYLTGISMGAATVMNAAGEKLPENVVGVLADCGFNSPRDIIQKVIVDMKMPPRLSYPFVKLGARIFGGFNLEEKSPQEALKRCKVPVIFFHGDTDDYVPCWMSQVNYDCCASEKKLVIVPGAGHGLSCMLDREGYMSALRQFWNIT